MCAPPRRPVEIDTRGGARALIYSEGMHRRTAAAEVAAVATLAAVATQPRVDRETFAVEPEDLDALPALVAALNPRGLALYERTVPGATTSACPLSTLSNTPSISRSGVRG